LAFSQKSKSKKIFVRVCRKREEDLVEMRREEKTREMEMRGGGTEVKKREIGNGEGE